MPKNNLVYIAEPLPGTRINTIYNQSFLQVVRLDKKSCFIEDVPSSRMDERQTARCKRTLSEAFVLPAEGTKFNTSSLQFQNLLLR
jgi:hypothetical protein